MRVAIFEGVPVKTMKAGNFRHYMVIIIKARDLMMTSTGIGTSPAALLNCYKGAKFYQHGTWELGPYLGDKFPAPRPEILAELKGEHQTEFAP